MEFLLDPSELYADIDAVADAWILASRHAKRHA